MVLRQAVHAVNRLFLRRRVHRHFAHRTLVAHEGTDVAVGVCDLHTVGPSPDPAPPDQRGQVLAIQVGEEQRHQFQHIGERHPHDEREAHHQQRLPDNISQCHLTDFFRMVVARPPAAPPDGTPPGNGTEHAVSGARAEGRNRPARRPERPVRRRRKARTAPGHAGTRTGKRIGKEKG